MYCRHRERDRNRKVASMTASTPSPVDLLVDLEARLAELTRPERAGHPDNIPDFQADIATPAVAHRLSEELCALVHRLQTDRASPDDWARLERVEGLATTVSMMAFMASLPIGDAFSAILHDAQVARRRLRPNDIDPRRDRVTSLMDSKGNVVSLPTRPGAFTIGGPGADVVIEGLVGVRASGQILPDGRVAVTKLADRPIGRNEPCPCRSGRKYKRCCLN
jgi:hypothetical protein